MRRTCTTAAAKVNAQTEERRDRRSAPIRLTPTRRPSTPARKTAPGRYVAIATTSGGFEQWRASTR